MERSIDGACCQVSMAFPRCCQERGSAHGGAAGGEVREGRKEGGEGRKEGCLGEEEGGIKNMPRARTWSACHYMIEHGGCGGFDGVLTLPSLNLEPLSLLPSLPPSLHRPSRCTFRLFPSSHHLLYGVWVALGLCILRAVLDRLVFGVRGRKGGRERGREGGREDDFPLVAYVKSRKRKRWVSSLLGLSIFTPHLHSLSEFMP